MKGWLMGIKGIGESIAETYATALAGAGYTEVSDLESITRDTLAYINMTNQLHVDRIMQAAKGSASGNDQAQMENTIAQLSLKLDTLILAINKQHEFDESELDDWTHVSVDTPKGWKKALSDFYGWPKQQDKYMCMVLGRYYPSKQITASHLSMRSTRGKTLVLLGLDAKDLHNVRNGLLLHTMIEQQFDVKGLCFLYDPFKRMFFLFVVNPALMDLPVVDGVMFHDIHLTPLLIHNSDCWPYRLVLNAHARACFRFGKKERWISEDNIVFDFFDLSDGVPESKFPNPNKNLQTAKCVNESRVIARVEHNAIYVDVTRLVVDDNAQGWADVWYMVKKKVFKKYMKLENLRWYAKYNK